MEVKEVARQTQKQRLERMGRETNRDSLKVEGSWSRSCPVDRLVEHVLPHGPQEQQKLPRGPPGGGQEQVERVLNFRSDVKKVQLLNRLKKESTKENLYSRIFDVKDDIEAITLMKEQKPEFWKIDSTKPGMKENLLHFFLNEKFLKSLDFLLTYNHPHVGEIQSWICVRTRKQ